MILFSVCCILLTKLGVDEWRKYKKLIRKYKRGLLPNVLNSIEQEIIGIDDMQYDIIKEVITKEFNDFKTQARGIK